jgi:hypothetical protein
MVPVVVQVLDHVTEEEREKEDEEEVDESDQRKQRTVEVGEQPSCCPKSLLYRNKNTISSLLIKT